LISKVLQEAQYIKYFDAGSAEEILAEIQGPKSSPPSFVREWRIVMRFEKRALWQGGIGGFTIG
jgi:hypothetical protein